MMSRLTLKPMHTLSQFLVRPKDKILKERVVGPVYHISCGSYDASYILGETERSLKARLLEHRPSSTASEVAQHIHTYIYKDNLNFQVDMDEVKI